MIIETIIPLRRPICTCPICGKKFERAIEHAYKTSKGKPICSYTCYMKYNRAEHDKFMKKHGDEFK